MGESHNTHRGDESKNKTLVVKYDMKRPLVRSR
jgi:hypothetical protein